MKLFQINTTVNSGSTGRIAEDIGSHIINSGGESMIAFGRNGNESNSKIYKIGGQLDQFNHLIQTRLFDSHGFHSYSSTKKLLKKIDFFNPDIIHLHNLHGYYSNVELLFNFLKEYKKPVVWTLHDCWAFTGHCCYFERVKCDKWKTQCGECPLQFLYPKSLVKDNSSLNFERKRNVFQGVKNLRIITVSNWLKEQVKLSFLREYNIETIYNGLDMNIFKPFENVESKKMLGLIGFKVILGVANEWSDGKGLKVFLEMAKILDNQYKIVLVGLNENQIKSLPDNIIGFKRTNNLIELVEFYNAADVFVSPSIAETFGMVVAEALSCGTPCVVNNSSALPELVSSDVGEIIYEQDHVKYYESICNIIEKGKDHYKLNCRMRAVKLFELENHCYSYSKLYKDLIHS